MTSPEPALTSAARAAVALERPRLLALSHAIAGDPELALDEHRAAARCTDLLESGGLAVQRGAYGMPTAFTATAGSRGPHVVVCAEYDALPGVGHACGHNVIAAAAVGAGLALAQVAERAGLRVTVLGTPAEERFGGKVELINAGAFAGVDAAMMVHPAPYDDYLSSSLAIDDWNVTVRGKAAHASSYPWLGRNALDGLVAGYTAIAMLRQHLRPGQQVHGIISDGGAAPNVVPEIAAARYYLRAADVEDLTDLQERVRACLEGAVRATGTHLEIEVEGHTYLPLAPSARLAEVFTQACTAIGRVCDPPPGNEIGGSTDMGNVSQLLPAIHPMLGIASWPAVNHQPEFTAHCTTEPADRAVLDGAAAMALTALAIAADRELLTP